MQKRKYQEIWERIKSKGAATIVCHPALVARVKKAVIKEKNIDLGFKVVNDHDEFRLSVSVVEKSKSEATVKFSLRQKFDLEERREA